MAVLLEKVLSTNIQTNKQYNFIDICRLRFFNWPETFVQKILLRWDKSFV